MGHSGLPKEADSILFVLTLRKFPHGLPDTAGEAREVLAAENEHDDEKDDEEVGACEIEKSGEIHCKGVLVRFAQRGGRSLRRSLSIRRKAALLAEKCDLQRQ